VHRVFEIYRQFILGGAGDIVCEHAKKMVSIAYFFLAYLSLGAFFRFIGNTHQFFPVIFGWNYVKDEMY